MQRSDQGVGYLEVKLVWLDQGSEVMEKGWPLNCPVVRRIGSEGAARRRLMDNGDGRRPPLQLAKAVHKVGEVVELLGERLHRACYRVFVAVNVFKDFVIALSWPKTSSQAL